MSIRTKELIREIVAHVWNRADFDFSATHIASDFIDHSSLQELYGPVEYQQYFSAFHKGFPDICFSVEDVVAEGDKVVVRWTATGSHQGEFQGIPASNRQMRVSGMTLTRIANSKMVESWTVWDSCGLMQQLCVPPLPDYQHQLETVLVD